MSQVRLSVDGPPGAEVALWQWLRAEPELRGQVRREQVAAEAGAMDGATGLVVALASTGTLAAVARAVVVWLTHRHGDYTVTVIWPDGATVALDAKRAQAGDVERLLRVAEETSLSPDMPPDTSSGTSQGVTPPTVP